MTIISTPQKGDPNTRIILEWCPAAYTGNTPGIQYDVFLTRQEALNFYKYLVKGQQTADGWVPSLREQIAQGITRVPGQNYARVGMWLNPGAKLLIFLTEEEVENISLRVLEALDWAKTNPKLFV